MDKFTIRNCTADLSKALKLFLIRCSMNVAVNISKLPINELTF